MSNLDKVKNFISRAEKIHHGKYDYSKVIIASNLKEMVEIICPNHGSFKVKASSHLLGYNCRKCYSENIPTKITKSVQIKKENTSRKNPEKYGKLFIEKAKSKFGDKYDYSKVDYRDAKSPVIISCKEHGSFMQKPIIHLSGAGGCQMCSGRKDMVRCDHDAFIRKAVKIHGDKYDYSLVNYKDKISSITIICREHGAFEQPARSHLKGRGCNKCKAASMKIGESEILDRIIKVHGNKYSYTNLNYNNKNCKINIICKKHGAFEQRLVVHLRGSGCRKCFTEAATITKDFFVVKANEIYKNKYDYSLANVIKSDIKVTIKCPEHGNFQKTPRTHLIGQGCPKCSGCARITREYFIERAEKLHEGKYDYSKVEIIDPRTKITIICSKHGEFLQSYNCHLNGKGCNRCRYANKKSKIEVKWIKSLNNKNITLDPPIIKIGKRKVIPDGYDPTTKTIYEFHGDYWHGNPEVYDPDELNSVAGKTFGELYQRTIDRENLIRSAGYGLVTIWERDFKKGRRQAP